MADLAAARAACARASAQGAESVAVVEPDARRRKTGKRFGATAVIDSARSGDEIIERIKALTGWPWGGCGARAFGQADAVELGVRLLRTGGRMVLAGSVSPSRSVSLDPESLVRRWIRVPGVHNYAPEDLDAALEFLASAGARYPFADLVSKTFPLTDVNEAFAFAERERPPRVGLLPARS